MLLSILNTCTHTHIYEQILTNKNSIWCYFLFRVVFALCNGLAKGYNIKIVVLGVTVTVNYCKSFFLSLLSVTSLWILLNK